MVLRPAKMADASQLALLMDIASQGLVSGVWNALAGPDQSPLELGRTRIRESRELPSHFSRWTVFEHQKEICGAYAGYVIADPYDPGDISALPEEYAPLLELEALAKGCWFLMALAVFSEHRRKGIGTLLLQHAYSQAHNSGVSMALTVSNENQVAKNMYLDAGFKESTRRKRLPITSLGQQNEWILLVKE